MAENGEVRALTAREQIALMLEHRHEENMARATAPREAHFELQQIAPPGKTGGFSFTVAGPDADAVEAKALEWAEKFPAPQPVAK